MKNHIKHLILGLSIMGSTSSNSCETLFTPDKDKEIYSSLKQKITDGSLKKHIRLGNKYREWLFEKHHYASVEEVSEDYKADPQNACFEDADNACKKLADFYTYKHRQSLAEKWYRESAKWILRGVKHESQNHVCFLARLKEEGHLSESVYKNILGMNKQPASEEYRKCKKAAEDVIVNYLRKTQLKDKSREKGEEGLYPSLKNQEFIDALIDEFKERLETEEAQ